VPTTSPSCGSPTVGTPCKNMVGARPPTGVATTTTAGSVFTLNGRRPIHPMSPSCMSATTKPTRSRVGGNASPNRVEWETGVSCQVPNEVRSDGLQSAGLNASAPYRARLQPRPPPRVLVCARHSRRLGKDRECVFAVSTFRTRARRGRDYNGKFMERPNGAAGKRLHHTGRSRPRGRTATSFRPPALDVRRPSGSRPTPDDHHHQGPDYADTRRFDAARRVHLTADDRRAALRLDADQGLRATPKESRPSGSTTHAAPSCR